VQFGDVLVDGHVEAHTNLVGRQLLRAGNGARIRVAVELRNHHGHGRGVSRKGDCKLPGEHHIAEPSYHRRRCRARIEFAAANLYRCRGGGVSQIDNPKGPEEHPIRVVVISAVHAHAG